MDRARAKQVLESYCAQFERYRDGYLKISLRDLRNIHEYVEYLENLTKELKDLTIETRMARFDDYGRKF